MAVTLIFVRHAETDLAGTFCGSSDPALNAAGEMQLAPLLARLQGCNAAAVYASDLQRTRQTAGFLATGLSLPLSLRPALRELDFGTWEGLTWEQIEQRDPVYAARWVSGFPALPAPGGESIVLFRHRVLEELDWLRARSASLIVVTHAAVLRVLLEDLGHFSPHHAWERTRDYTCTIRCIQHAVKGRIDVDV